MSWQILLIPLAGVLAFFIGLKLADLFHWFERRAEQRRLKKKHEPAFHAFHHR